MTPHAVLAAIKQMRTLPRYRVHDCALEAIEQKFEAFMSAKDKFNPATELKREATSFYKFAQDNAQAQLKRLMHEVIVMCVKAMPTNNTCPITLCEIDPTKSVAVSTGQIFDIDILIEYNRKRDPKFDWGESETNGLRWLVNPYTNLRLSEDDAQHIIREAKSRGINTDKIISEEPNTANTERLAALIRPSLSDYLEAFFVPVMNNIYFAILRETLAQFDDDDDNTYNSSPDSNQSHDSSTGPQLNPNVNPSSSSGFFSQRTSSSSTRRRDNPSANETTDDSQSSHRLAGTKRRQPG